MEIDKETNKQVYKQHSLGVLQTWKLPRFHDNSSFFRQWCNRQVLRQSVNVVSFQCPHQQLFLATKTFVSKNQSCHSYQINVTPIYIYLFISRFCTFSCVVWIPCNSHSKGKKQDKEKKKSWHLFIGLLYGLLNHHYVMDFDPYNSSRP